MKCHYCGTELHGSEVFCRYCGTRQNIEAAPELPVIAAEPAPIPAEPAATPAEPFPEVRTFDLKPLRGEAPDAALNETPFFDFEKAAALSGAPKLQLPTKRGLGKMIFLSILTLGIYPTVIWSRLVGEVNMVASRYDGERSMSFFGMLMLSPLTLGIHTLVWFHKLCRRIGTELQRRHVGYAFGARDFWLWNFLLGFLFAVCTGTATALYAVGHHSYWLIWALLAVGLLTLVGPFVFVYKLMKAMNKLNEHYNVNG